MGYFKFQKKNCNENSFPFCFLQVHTATAFTSGAGWEVWHMMIQVTCWWRATLGRRANLNTRTITAATVPDKCIGI